MIFPISNVLAARRYEDIPASDHLPTLRQRLPEITLRIGRNRALPALLRSAMAWSPACAWPCTAPDVDGGIILFLACIFPVISVGFHGMATDVTLWNVAWALAAGDGNPIMAVCTAFLLVIAPFLQITLTVWLLSFAYFARPAPAFIFIMRALKWLHPWSMVEVGVLGFLVAGIKLSSLLDVSIGPGGSPHVRIVVASD